MLAPNFFGTCLFPRPRAARSLPCVCMYALAFSLGDGIMEELVALCGRWGVTAVRR